MDPLTLFVASIVGSMVAEALRTRRELSEYYPKSARGELEHYLGWMSMDGDRVRWLVEEGQAVWIEARYLRPISGNIFDPDKLGAVARGIRQQPAGERIAFYASYGQIHRIGPSDVAESISYQEYDTGVPWTTGDAALDEWLVERSTVGGRRSAVSDEDVEMEKRLADAVMEGEGDLGKWTATTRDGNHRTFGAVLGGEIRVAVRFYDNDAQDIQQAVRRKVEGRPPEWNDDEMLDLLRKAILDTGRLPHWLDPDDAVRFHLASSPETKLLPMWMADLEESKGKVYVTVEGLGRVLEVLDGGRGALKPIQKGLDTELFPDDGGEGFRHLHRTALERTREPPPEWLDRFEELTVGGHLGVDLPAKPGSAFVKAEVESVLREAVKKNLVEQVVDALLERGVPPHLIFLAKFVLRYRWLFYPTVIDLLPENWQEAIDEAIRADAAHDPDLVKDFLRKHGIPVP